MRPCIKSVGTWTEKPGPGCFLLVVHVVFYAASVVYRVLLGALCLPGLQWTLQRGRDTVTLKVGGFLCSMQLPLHPGVAWGPQGLLARATIGALVVQLRDAQRAFAPVPQMMVSKSFLLMQTCTLCHSLHLSSSLHQPTCISPPLLSFPSSSHNSSPGSFAEGLNKQGREGINHRGVSGQAPGRFPILETITRASWPLFGNHSLGLEG